MPDELISVKEFAERYKLSRTTVYKWIDVGKLPVEITGLRQVKRIPLHKLSPELTAIIQRTNQQHRQRYYHGFL